MRVCTGWSEDLLVAHTTLLEISCCRSYLFKIPYTRFKNFGVAPHQLASGEGKKEGKDQESIQSSTTPDPGYQWESDNFTIRHHKREPIGQPFPRR